MSPPSSREDVSAGVMVPSAVYHYRQSELAGVRPEPGRPLVRMLRPEEVPPTTLCNLVPVASSETHHLDETGEFVIYTVGHHFPQPIGAWGMQFTFLREDWNMQQRIYSEMTLAVARLRTSVAEQWAKFR